MNTGTKGFRAEESLRSYFRSIGYFVVRGIPLRYRNYDVTDVDLWLYVKTTSHTVDRVCVDVKNKSTPKAMERVLWTRGLKEILGVDRAIVVTSDNRVETRDFGASHAVGILHGEFLQRVISNFLPSDRLTEEDLLSLLKTPCIVDPKIEWWRWYGHKKAMLLDSLDFDGCNSYIMAAKQLFDEYLATSKSADGPLRLLYIVIAYFLICFDFTSRSIVHLDQSQRSVLLTDGFRYGEAGRQRTEEIVQMALHLLVETGKTDPLFGTTLRSEFERQMSAYRAEILGEYFAKTEALRNLFNIARAFEDHAYAHRLLHPHELPSEQKAIIGLICDLLGYDRKTMI